MYLVSVPRRIIHFNPLTWAPPSCQPDCSPGGRCHTENASSNQQHTILLPTRGVGMHLQALPTLCLSASLGSSLSGACSGAGLQDLAFFPLNRDRVLAGGNTGQASTYTPSNAHPAALVPVHAPALSQTDSQIISWLGDQMIGLVCSTYKSAAHIIELVCLSHLMV